MLLANERYGAPRTSGPIVNGFQWTNPYSGNHGDLVTSIVSTLLALSISMSKANLIDLLMAD